MISKYNYKNISWIDIDMPTRNEVIETCEDYKIPKIIGQELLVETLKSKVDYHEKENIIYLVLHFPFFDKKENAIVEKEIDFILGKNFILTAHYQDIEPLHEIYKNFENEDILIKEKIGENPGFIFFHIVKHFYKYLDSQLDSIATNLEKIETDIFNHKEQIAVTNISQVNRRIIRFRKAISFHGDIIKSLEPVGSDIFGSGFSFNMSMLLSEYNKVNSTVSWHKEILDDLRKTNTSLLSTKTNETIKRLTIMTFIMMPITLITGIFGMNVTKDNFLLKSHGDFFLVIFMMILMGFIMYIYFKLRKWL